TPWRLYRHAIGRESKRGVIGVDLLPDNPVSSHLQRRIALPIDGIGSRLAAKQRQVGPGLNVLAYRISVIAVLKLASVDTIAAGPDHGDVGPPADTGAVVHLVIDPQPIGCPGRGNVAT